MRRVDMDKRHAAFRNVRGLTLKGHAGNLLGRQTKSHQLLNHTQTITMNRKRTNLFTAIWRSIYWDKVLVAGCYFTAGILVTMARQLWGPEPSISFLLYLAALVAATGGAINQ